VYLDRSGGTDTTASQGHAQSAAVMSSGNTADRAMAACTRLMGAHCFAVMQAQAAGLRPTQNLTQALKVWL